MNYILYNPISGHGGSLECAEKIKAADDSQAKLVDITEINSYSEFISLLA